MAKFYGIVGYVKTVETEPGVYSEEITERTYFGDIIRNTRMLQNSSVGTNDNINISNQISIVSDPYAMQKFHSIRYVEFMGTNWKVTSVDASQYPRLILSMGGLYNGEQA